MAVEVQTTQFSLAHNFWHLIALYITMCSLS